MEIVILCLPVSHKEILEYTTFKKEENLEDLIDANLSTKIFKMSGDNTVDNNITFNEKRGDQIIKSTLIDINYLPDSESILESKESKDSLDSCQRKGTEISKIRSLTEIDIRDIKYYKTDIYCWWCCHGFEEYPVSVPIKLYPKNHLFKCKGIFCGFSCALAYCIANKHDQSLLKMLYKKILNLKFSEIQQITKAPPKEILQRFGGPVSIEEYRKHDISLNKYNIIVYPMIFVDTLLHIEILNGDYSHNCGKKSEKNKPSLLSDTVAKRAKHRIEKENSLNINKNSVVELLKNNTVAANA